MSRRLYVLVAASAAAHIAVGIGAGVFAARSWSVPPSDVEARMAIVPVDIDDLAPISPMVDTPTTEPTSPVPSRETHIASTTGPRIGGVVSAAAAGVGSGTGSPSSEGAPIAGTDGDGPREARAPINLGLGPGAFWPRYGQPESFAPRAAAAPRGASSTGGLREALREHDVAIGLGSGGPVVSAMHGVANSSVALGAATFTVSVDASGRVQSVSLSDATRDGDAWRQLGASLLASLRASRLRVPSGANGLILIVKVDAEVVLPSGSGSVIRPKGPGAEFDLADIGQKPKRVVHARVVSERVI